MEAELYPSDILAGIVLPATTKNLTIWVSTTGDDTTGNGSAGKPYLTITKAFEQVPHVIRHKINVRIGAGAYTDWPRVIRHVAEGDGQLTVEGLGTPTVVAGPFTLTGAADLGSGRGWDLTVATAGWGVDDYAGKFIRFTDTGDLIDRIIPVHRNSADIIETLDTATYGASIPAAGTTFNVIEPTVEVTLANDSSVFDLTSNGIRRGANFIFANLWLDNPTTERVAFNFVNTGRVGTGLVKFSSLAPYNETLNIAGGDLNSDTLYDWDWTQLVDPRLVRSLPMPTKTMLWFSVVVENRYGGGLDPTNPGICFSGMRTSGYHGINSVARCSTRALVTIYETRAGLSHCRTGRINVDHQGVGAIYRVAVSLGAEAIDGIRVDDLSQAELQDVIVTSTGADAIQIEDLCRMLFENVQVTTAKVVGYGLRVGRGSRVVCCDASAPTGTLGAIHFDQTNTTVGFPAAKNWVTDGVGSSVTA